MSPEALKSLEPGTKLMTAERFTNGDDPDIEHLLNSVITFSKFDGAQWVYHEEAPDSPFHRKEIVGIYQEGCLDDESTPYEMGDISALIGGV